MTHHTIQYLEFGVTDLAASQEFFAAAFGWEFNDYGPAYAGIRASDGDGEVGGLDAGSPPGPGGTLALVQSDDVEASLAAVEAAGGVVVDPLAPYPGGRRFTFADPSGNHLGVFQVAT